MRARLEEMYKDSLQDEYGYDLPRLESLLETTEWAATELGVSIDDEYSMLTLVHLASWAYNLGFDEGVAP